jgi:hypothetical protein
MERLTSPRHDSQYRSICLAAVTASNALTHPEDWDDLEWNVLKTSRTGSPCIACQDLRYEVGRHCITLLTCPIHQGLIPQGEHLSK